MHPPHTLPLFINVPTASAIFQTLQSRRLYGHKLLSAKEEVHKETNNKMAEVVAKKCIEEK